MESKIVQAIRTIYVSNLPWTIGSRELKNYFSKYGPVNNVHVIFDKSTGLSKGYGFIRFKDQTSQQSVFETVEHHLDHRRVFLRFSDN